MTNIPLLVALFCTSSVTPGARSPRSSGELMQILRSVDERQQDAGDFRSVVYLEQKERNKADTIYEAVIFRRDQNAQFMMLFTKPKVAEGQGYLKADKNLWFYDPGVGKWERRTERERIAGTNSRRADFDRSRLAEDYDPEDLGDEKLGHYDAVVMLLNGRSGRDLAFPRVKLWVDKESKNVIKRQDFALSGRLLRTGYYPRWKSAYSEAKKAVVWYAEEIRLFDEIEKSNSTVIVTKSVDFKRIEDNIFTKAWLESKSR